MAGLTVDIVPLSWVKGEIDQELAHARECLDRPADAAQWRLTRSHLHQVSGVLQMVGLDGCAKVCGEIEALATAAETRPGDFPQASGLARRAILTLSRFLEELLNGEPNQPLRLFPAYRDLRHALGEAANEAELFFPDLGVPPPSRDGPAPNARALAHLARVARTRYQRGLAPWLRNPADRAALKEMWAALSALDRLCLPPGQRSFWWCASAMLDGIARKVLEPDKRVRQVCGRIDQELKRLSEGAPQATERLLRELLFIIAGVPPATERLRAVRKAYSLAQHMPPAGIGQEQLEPAERARRALMDAVASAKGAWDRCSGGHAASIDAFITHAARIKQVATEIRSQPLVRLIRVLGAAAVELRTHPQRMSEVLAIEMASGLLLLEQGVDQLPEISPAFSRQVDALVARVRSAALGQWDETTVPPLVNDLSRRAQERALLTQVAGEILANLRQGEAVLDAFFRDPRQRAELPALKPLTEQVKGTFRILGMEQAAELTAACQGLIGRFLEPGYEPDQRDMELVALGFSSLGFFTEALKHGQAERAPVVEPVLAQIRAALAGPSEEPPAAAAPAAPAGAADEGGEEISELLAVFIEEAREVLAGLRDHLQTCGADLGNREALATIRRGVHTLKGSGRMVGLTELADVAWQVEQILNRWLEEQRPATTELLGMVDFARRHFTDWVSELARSGRARIDANILNARIEAIHESLKNAAAEAGPDLTILATDLAAAQAAAKEEEAAAAAEPEEPVAPVQESDFIDEGTDLPVLVDLADAPEPPAAAEAPPVEVPEPPAAPAEPPAAEALPEPGPALEPEPVPEPEPVAVHRAEEPAPEPVAGEPSLVRIGALELDRVLWDILCREAGEHLATLADGSARLAGEGGTPDEAMVRAAHTLAGIARTSAMDFIAGLAQALEEWLQALRRDPARRSAASAQVVEDSVAALAEMVEAVRVEQAPAPELAERAARLAEALEDLSRHARTESRPVTRAASLLANLAASAVAESEPGQIADDLDPELLPVFLEEAGELIPAIAGGLRAWHLRPASIGAGEDVKRGLHTLKGSARMAGAMRVGDLAHRLESRVEAVLDAGPAPGPVEELLSAFDRLAVLVESLPVLGTPGAAVTAAAPAGEVAEAAPEAAQPLRVRSDVVEELLNGAGEVAIARSRVESEMRTLKQSLLELTNNVIRLRAQLREVEIQAETQMASRRGGLTEDEGEFDPLEFDRYTRFQELTRMIAESVNDVATVQQALLRGVGDAEAALNHQGRTTRELQHSLMRVRSTPFDAELERLHRVVRLTAQTLFRRAELLIDGGHVELDRGVLQRILPALEHLLRNAVAHGIEDPAARQEKGKPEVARIDLTVKREGNEILITVADDGAGLDLAAVRRRAEQLDLVAPGEKLSETETAALIFAHGLSTGGEVTQTSGRGVGLDVVKNEITALGGRVEVSTQPGLGTSFRLWLPQSLAVVQALLVRSGPHVYAIPAAMVEQIQELKADALEALYGSRKLAWMGHVYRPRYLPWLLGDRGAVPEARRYNKVLLLARANSRVALHVEDLISRDEVVVKRIGPQLGQVSWVDGATVLADGTIALIINPVALADRPEPAALPAPAQAAEAPRVPTVMVVDDSLTVRKVTGRLLAREGYEVVSARDGMEALEMLQENLPDVILLDIEMPRMDGFDFTRNVRADPRTAPMPIIIISSRTAEKHRRHAAELGVNDYLGKPYDEDELLELVRRYAGAATESA